MNDYVTRKEFTRLIVLLLKTPCPEEEAARISPTYLLEQQIALRADQTIFDIFEQAPEIRLNDMDLKMWIDKSPKAWVIEIGGKDANLYPVYLQRLEENLAEANFKSIIVRIYHSK